MMRHYAGRSKPTRCRSLIAGGDASPLSNVPDVPAGSVVLSAVGTGPPHVGVQDAGPNVMDAVPLTRAASASTGSPTPSSRQGHGSAGRPVSSPLRRGQAVADSRPAKFGTVHP